MAKRKARSLSSRFTPKVDLAAPVSARVQIKHVILAQAVAKRGPRHGGPPTTLTMNVNVKTKVNKKERLIQVFPQFTLIAAGKDQTAEEQLHIEALFLLQYEIDSFKDLKKPNLDAFGELNGLYNVWPYWREYVQSTTVRMGLPPLTIPVFRPLDEGAVPEGKTSAVRRRRSARGAARP